MSSDAEALAAQLVPSPARSQPAVVLRSSGEHIPGLDGLRGIAILGVLVMHALEGQPSAPGVDTSLLRIASVGWMGVDLFFVLSGFLITGILLDQRVRPAVLRTFYGRRFLRIVPVYVVFLVCWMWVAPAVGAIPVSFGAELRAAQGWFWTYLVNIYLVFHVGGNLPTHLWSLAVEEQFYLLWPFAVLALSPRTLMRTALACIVVAEVSRVLVVVIGAPAQTNFVLLPTRMDTLAVGALLACAVRDPALFRVVERWSVPAILLATVSLLTGAVLSHKLRAELPLVQLLGYPAIAVLSGALVFAVSQSPTLFAGRVLRFVGRYSYGIDIWHWLVLVMLKHTTSLFTAGEPSIVRHATMVAVLLACSLAVALVSWYAVEAPFLRLKRLFPYARPVAS